MITEDQKDTQTESIAVSVLDNLKTSNLPEIIGWKEKQEKLVKDNPYLEIVDTKTYDEACKRRTALLKGRTELKSQDTKIASKLSAFRKEVGTETAALIAITQPHEEKQDAEVKRWESVKAKEKEEKANAEANRVKAIQDKLESVETEAYKIIQPMLFSEIEAKSKEVEVLLKADGFDFEEYDAVLDQVISRVESALELKVKNLTEQENQRVENEKLKKEQEASKAKEELQNKRLQEILPYIAFGEPIDATKLHEISEEQYQLILSNKKVLHETKAKADAKLEEERLAKEKEEKEAVLIIRRNRLNEIGFNFAAFQGFNHRVYPQVKVNSTEVYEANTVEFESIYSKAKSDIEAEELKIERKANREKLFSDLGMPLVEYNFGLKVNLAFSTDRVLSIDEVFDSSDSDFSILLNDVKKSFLDHRISCVTDLGYVHNKVTENFELDGFDSYSTDFIDFTKEFFEEKVSEIKAHIEAVNLKKSEEEVQRLKAESKERVKKFAKDKKSLTEFLESLDFRIAVPEMENKEMEEILNVMVTQVNTFISESVEIVNKY